MTLSRCSEPPCRLQLWAVLGALPLLLFVAALPILPLMEPDETRYALIPQAMLQTGDYVTPRLMGVAYLEKPPLLYWVTAGFLRLFGENAFAARLPAGLSAWGCLWLLYVMGAHFHDRKTGLYGAVVFATSALPFLLGRLNILDMPLTAFLGWALWAGYRALTGDGKDWRRWSALFGLCCAAAFLTKGVVGAVFPGAILFLWSLATGRFRFLHRLVILPGALFLLLTLPWIWAAQLENSDFLWFFFVQEHWLRYTTDFHERTEPFYYYLPVLLGGSLPWLAALVWTCKRRVRPPAGLFTRDESALILLWTGFIFLFFTLASSKLASYITPAFIPLSLGMGRLFRAADGGGGQRRGGLFTWRDIPVIVLSLALAATLAIPFAVAEYRQMVAPAPIWFALPLAAALLMAVVPPWAGRLRPEGRFYSLAGLFACFLVTVLFPAAHYLTPGKSAVPAARAVASLVPPSAPIYQYQSTLYGIDWYTGRRTVIVDDLGELAFGAGKLTPQERRLRFPTVADFAVQIGTQGTVYVVTEGRHKVTALGRMAKETNVLWDNGKFYLLRLRGGPPEGKS